MFGPPEDLEKLNLSAGLEVLELLIRRVESELQSRKCDNQDLCSDMVSLKYFVEQQIISH